MKIFRSLFAKQHPEKLGIKNADLWMEINKDKLNENATPRSKE